MSIFPNIDIIQNYSKLPKPKLYRDSARIITIAEMKNIYKDLYLINVRLIKNDKR